jgi:hypothetical protein
MGNVEYKSVYSLNKYPLNMNQLKLEDHNELITNESVCIFMGPRFGKRKNITPFMIITDNSLSSLTSMSNNPNILRRLTYPLAYIQQLPLINRSEP